MPFKLRKAPKRDLYWVVDDKGKHYSKDPLPKKRARQQQKALYAAEGRGEMKGGVILKQQRDDGIYLIDGHANKVLAGPLTEANADRMIRQHAEFSLTHPGYQYGFTGDTQTPVGRPPVNEPVPEVRLQLAKKQLLKEAIKKVLSENPPDFSDPSRRSAPHPTQPPQLTPSSTSGAVGMPRFSGSLQFFG